MIFSVLGIMSVLNLCLQFAAMFFVVVELWEAWQMFFVGQKVMPFISKCHKQITRCRDRSLV